MNIIIWSSYWYQYEFIKSCLLKSFEYWVKILGHPSVDFCGCLFCICPFLNLTLQIFSKGGRIENNFSKTTFTCDRSSKDWCMFGSLQVSFWTKSNLKTSDELLELLSLSSSLILFENFAYRTYLSVLFEFPLNSFLNPWLQFLDIHIICKHFLRSENAIFGISKFRSFLLSLGTHSMATKRIEPYIFWKVSTSRFRFPKGIFGMHAVKKWRRGKVGQGGPVFPIIRGAEIAASLVRKLLHCGLSLWRSEISVLCALREKPDQPSRLSSGVTSY